MEDASFKVCPFCKEKIRKEAVKCRFCGEWLEQSEQCVSPATSTGATLLDPLEPTRAPLEQKAENLTADTPKSKKEISVKTLYWTGGVLLGICTLIWFACLVQVPWQRISPVERGKLIGNLIGGGLKMFIAIGLVTWGG